MLIPQFNVFVEFHSQGFKCSAKTGDNIKKACKTLVAQIVKNHEVPSVFVRFTATSILLFFSYLSRVKIFADLNFQLFCSKFEALYPSPMFISVGAGERPKSAR